jgi:hypothetical protein
MLFFEHTSARDCRGSWRAPRSARGPSISKARLRTGAMSSGVRIMRPVAPNAPAYFTVSTGPKATSDSRRYFSSS